MNVLYDSDTRPSQLNMTVSSFINVDSLDVYDAAYSGGSVVTETEPGDTVYVRVMVSDPFGEADITDVDLGITDIGCGSVTTTLDDPQEVANTASTRTFEYAWAVGACEGGYLITASANEGTEGVTARKAVPFDVKSPQFAAIGNYVWLDENGDGVQDAGEAGIANVTVELVDGSNAVIATTTTDSNGGYLFTDVDPGTYTVRTVSGSLPSGLAANPTYDEDSGTSSPDNATSVTVAGGDEHLTADFGYNWVPSGDSSNPSAGTTGAIGDTVWNDANGNGIQDPGESGIGGVTVTIYYDPDGDGVYDTPYAAAVNQAGGIGSTTTTEPDGSYVFDTLPVGSYVVEVDDTTLPAGPTWTQKGDPDGMLDDKTTAPIELGPGDVFVNADFGYQPSTGSTIGDTIFIDPNGNGTQDAGEPGIPGVTVALEDSTGKIIATDVTDKDGKYSFPGLPSGDYKVVVTDTENVLGELAPISNPDGGTPDNKGALINVNGTADNLDQDFGYAPPSHVSGKGLIGDTIYLDRDGNGTQDPDGADNVLGTADDEPGLEGVTVNLYDAAGTTLLATTTTDENGNYFFGDLDDATYTVKVDTTTLPGAPGDPMTNTGDPDGGTANQSSNVIISGGNTNLDQDFGYQDQTTPNTIAGTIWNDVNADGILSGETGFYAGVTVVLKDSNGDVVGTAITDAGGNYSFPGLPNGSYTVDVTDTANVLDGTWHTVGDQNVATDNTSKNDPYTVSVSSGQTVSTVDFGYYKDLAALGNFVWADDGDGVQRSRRTGHPRRGRQADRHLSRRRHSRAEHRDRRQRLLQLRQPAGRRELCRGQQRCGAGWTAELHHQHRRRPSGPERLRADRHRSRRQCQAGFQQPGRRHCRTDTGRDRRNNPGSGRQRKRCRRL